MALSEPITSVPGPGTLHAAEEFLTAESAQERGGILRSSIREIYGHPIRNALYWAYLTPWNIRHGATTGYKWRGLIGWRGIAGTTNFPLNPVVLTRRLAGAVGSGLFRFMGYTRAAVRWRALGRGGLVGLAGVSKQPWQAIVRSAAAILGGSETELGLFGRGLLRETAETPAFYRYTSRPNLLGVTRLAGEEGGWVYRPPVGLGEVDRIAVKLLEADRAKVTRVFDAVSAKYGKRFLMGPWEAFGIGGPSRSTIIRAYKFAREGVRQQTGLWLAYEPFKKSFVAWSRRAAVMHYAGGIATLALLYDIAKFSFKQAHKLTRFAIERGTQLAENLVRQDWGAYTPAGFLTAGATTERQRALDEINRSSLNARSLLGTEATLAARTYLGGRIV